MKKYTFLLMLVFIISVSACNSAPILPKDAASTAIPQKEVKYIPILAVNKNDSTRGMVYLENPSTQERKPFLELSDLYSDHYHPVEYKNGNLFVLRRFEYEGLGDVDWRVELWVYDPSKNGRKIIASRTLDFRSSANGLNLAVNNNEKLFFMDINGNVFTQLTATQLGNELPGIQDSSFELEGWSDDDSHFWGNLFVAGEVLGFFETNPIGSKYKFYEISNVPFSRQEYDLNRNNGKLVFSDFPWFFDADSAERFKTSNRAVTLYLLDLYTMKLTQIATNTAKEFHPQWQGNDRFQYNDPNSQAQKLVYLVK